MTIRGDVEKHRPFSLPEIGSFDIKAALSPQVNLCYTYFRSC